MRGEDEFRWVAVAERDDAPLVVAEPATGSRRLVLSHHFILQPAERERLEALSGEERSELAWELFRHLNLLLVDYQADRTVPGEVLLLLTVTADGLTRDAFLRRVLRLSAALRLVLLIFHRALGTLLQGAGGAGYALEASTPREGHPESIPSASLGPSGGSAGARDAERVGSGGLTC